MSAAEKPIPATHDMAESGGARDARLDDIEKVEQKTPNLPGKTTDQQSLDDTSAITHLYLSFESDLPLPPRQLDGAPPPNLRNYTSPLTWSSSRKHLILALGCISTFLTAYVAGAYSPPSSLMAHAFHTTHTVTLVGISTFCAGFAIAPMVLAPVSEIWGRYPVFISAGGVTVIFQLACGFVTNIAGMLVCRFFVGAGVSVFSSVVGGVLADIYNKQDRNTAMALFSAAVLMGTGAGPLVTAGMVNIMTDGTKAWKWTFWHQAISNGILLISLVFLFSETRASVLLSRKARRLNAWYEKLEKQGVYGVLVRDTDIEGLVRSSESSIGSNGDEKHITGRETPRTLRRIRWKVKADEERASLSTMMATSVMRPFYMLVTEPVAFSFSLWAAFAWGVLYLAFAVVSYLHGDNYNAASRSYIAMVVGAVVAGATSIWQDDLLRHPQWRHDGAHNGSKFWAFMRKNFPAEAPEARLYFACITSFFLPAGLFGAFMVPQTSSPGDKGTSLAIGIGFATWGIYAVYLASFNYLADTYHIYASSALAANSFCRNLIGGSFPVVTAMMFDTLGIKGAGGLLAALATVLTTIPWVLTFWGAKIRARSKMAIMLQK